MDHVERNKEHAKMLNRTSCRPQKKKLCVECYTELGDDGNQEHVECYLRTPRQISEHYTECPDRRLVRS